MDFRDGQEFEINLRSKKFLTKINSILSKGLLLTIDYGYLSDELFSPERMKGTYKCLYKHTINETPYVNPGSQDITAHVDFGNLIRVGETLGFSRIIYTTQGQFLLDWGILEMIAENEEGEFSEHEIQSIKNLFLPGLMGDKFKVLIQGKNFQDAFNNFYPESPLKISFKVL
jgi:SAM-dependent MidA family methyltransferase